MRVKIDDLNHDGRGRGLAGERTALVSQALPGDLVEVREDRSSRITVQGRVAKHLERGPEHAEHPCPHVNRCTGCPLLTATERLEDRFKVERLRAWIAEVDPSLVSAVRPLERPAGPFGYRHYGKMALDDDGARLVAGSYVAGTHQVIDNRGCPVLLPALAELLESARARLEGLPVHSESALGLRHLVARWSRASGEAMIVVVSSGELDPIARRLEGLGNGVSVHALLNRDRGNRILSGQPRHLHGPVTIFERLLGYDHEIGPTSFFQVNPAAAERLFSIALDAAGTGSRCVEGYAGVGGLTLPLAERFTRVQANELNEESVALLRARAPNIEVHGGPAEEVLSRWLRDPVDAVVLDPPRKGLGERVARAVEKAAAERVVLLSCDPRSLTRDLPVLLQSFRLRGVTPVDQFPRTAHLETVTVLERR